MLIDDGRQVKAARAILGMPAAQLATEAGISKNSVLRVESLKRVRHGYCDEGGHSVRSIAKVIEARGIRCEMIDGEPVVRFATTAPPPKYRRKVPAAGPDNTGRKQATP